MHTLLLASLLFLSPAFAQAPVRPLPLVPVVPAKQAPSCSIHTDEVWLAADGMTMPTGTPTQHPAVATQGGNWYLHLKFTNTGDKDILSFDVHAKLTAVHFPSNPTSTDAAKADQPHRHWKGDLAPQANAATQWKIDAGAHYSGLERIWFDHVKFADGSEWTGDGGTSCSFGATGHMVPTQTP